MKRRKRENKRILSHALLQWWVALRKPPAFAGSQMPPSIVGYGLGA